MFTKRALREVTPDDDITCEDYNDLVREIKRLQLIQGPGIRIEQTELGQAVRAIAYQGMIMASIPSGGIAAATSNGATPPTITSGFADCDVMVFNGGVWKPATGKRRIYNDLLVAVAGPKISLVAPSEDGALHLIVLPC